MSHSQKPDPRAQSAEDLQQQAASRETKRPSDSVPVVSGQFANLPTRFGRYQVERLLGRGGMGAVYLARDTQLDRAVALKIPKVAASGSKRLLMRLQTEAKAAAKLDHPCLCKVHDAGEIDGQCFIAMQYIEGETLKSQLEAQPKSVEDAVSLILQLADGLSDAHELGIVHRDLKPENIMINRRGTPVIMDFGLAKFSTMSGGATATQAGTILGSPAYMSPEQASGNVKEIDQRSDIYSLGIILFELLTGQWPFSGSAMQILGQKSVMDPVSPLSLKPDLPPELAAICHKMIAKSNVNRYQTLKELTHDLKNLDLANLPTADLTPGLISFTAADETQSTRKTRRKGGRSLPQPALILGGVVAAILLFLGVTLWFQSGDALVKVEVHSDDVEVTFQNKTIQLASGIQKYSVTPGDHTLHIKSGETEFDTDKFLLKKGNNPSVAVELVQSEIVVKLGEKEITRQLRFNPKSIPKAQDSPAKLEIAQNTQPKPNVEPSKPIESVPEPASPMKSIVSLPESIPSEKPMPDNSAGQPSIRELATLRGHGHRVLGVVFSQDGKRLVSASDDHTLKIWDIATNQEHMTLKGHTDRVVSLALSADGERAWSASADQNVKVWNTESGKELRSIQLSGHSGLFRNVAFSADEKQMASVSDDGTAILWNVTSGRAIHKLLGHGGPVLCAAFSPDGKTLASGSNDRTVKLWNTKTGQETLQLQGHNGPVWAVAFSPDGKSLASAGEDVTVKIWDLASGQEKLKLSGYGCLAFSSDGKRLAAAGDVNNSVKVYETSTGQELHTLTGHGGQPWGVYGVAFAPDGKRLASASGDQTVKIWGEFMEVEPASKPAIAKPVAEPVAEPSLTAMEKRILASLVQIKVTGDVRMPVGVVTTVGVCTVMPGSFDQVELLTVDGQRTFAGKVAARSPFPFCWIESKTLNLKPVANVNVGKVNMPLNVMVAISRNGSIKLHASKIDASGALTVPDEIAPKNRGYAMLGPVFVANGTCLGFATRSNSEQPIRINAMKR